LAAPLDRADVPAEPTWVLHFDCDGLRPTAVGRYLLAEMDKPESQPKFAAFQTWFSFDPRKQLHGLTLYNTGNAPDDWVTLIYADFQPGRLVTLAKAAKESQTTNYGPHVVYSWIDERKSAGNGLKIRIYGAIEGQRVVLAQRPLRLSAALDVLDHTKPALSASKAFPELGVPGDASFIEAAARKLELPDSMPTAALFRLSKAMRLQVNETNRAVTATLNLEANSEALAQQTVLAVRGAAALAKLQKEKPEIARFAEALALKQEGSGVIATLTMPAVDFIEILKATTDKEGSKKIEKD
jgi:hypothetical protein